MEYDLMQVLAEPGKRQLAVFGLSALFGGAKRIWNTYHNVRMEEPVVRLKMLYDSTYLEQNKRIQKQDLWLTRASYLLPTGIGLEAAIESANPIGNYLFEGATDFASASAGYIAGSQAMTWLTIGVRKGARAIYSHFSGSSNKTE
ncbi:MAG: hypothetical protein QXK37_02895 [Candidatus Woesearchaeota archaeon]